MVCKKGMLQFRKDFTLILVQRGSKPIEGRETRTSSGNRVENFPQAFIMATAD
jgi:hypothetical protein